MLLKSAGRDTISPLFISRRDCSVVGFLFHFVLFCFFKPLTLLRLALGEKWNDEKNKACSHSDVCFHT